MRDHVALPSAMLTSFSLPESKSSLRRNSSSYWAQFLDILQGTAMLIAEVEN